jgi:phosphonate transport system substrate-binding protein
VTAAGLRLGTFLAPSTRPAYEAVAAAAAGELGAPVEVVDGAEIEDLDGAFLCGLPYVRDGLLEAVAAPVLEGERYGGRPVYYSDVVVSRGSHATSLADLRGARFAYNEAGSHSGHNVVLAELHRRGEDEGFFGSAVETGGHAASLVLVGDGGADCAAVDSQVLATEPELAGRVRVVEALGPSPAPPLAVVPTLPAEARAGLLRGALAAPAAAGVERWVEVFDADYEPIREMAAEAARARLVRRDSPER